MRGGLTAEHPLERGGGPTADALAPDPLRARVEARLDARLERGSARPVALGLSGGSDSLALLHLAAGWCARAGRPLLALTVDHGLSPESGAWTARAGRMAAEAGAAWRALAWTGPKPATGLPAAARRARHALLAEAARGAGARVVLLAHTADDRAEEAALRRGDAPGLGWLRPWAPSPAWPEGRGVCLLRPLLDTGGAELRARLAADGVAWLEDPANLDPRFARARARAAGPAPSADPADALHGFGHATPDGRVRLPPDRVAEGSSAARRSLRAALACASGTDAAVAGPALDALRARLSAEAEGVATLGGARVGWTGGEVDVTRDPGRRAPADVALAPGEPVAWDGRFEVRAAAPGWSVGLAQGRRARLPPADRRVLLALPPAARGMQPVFLRGGEVRLAPAEGLEARALAPGRFDAAVGRVRREADLP